MNKLAGFLHIWISKCRSIERNILTSSESECNWLEYCPSDESFWKVEKSRSSSRTNILCFKGQWCVERMESISCLPVLARSSFSIKLLIPVPGILSWTVKMRLQLIQQHYTIPCSLQLLAIFQSSSWNIQQSTLFNHLITQCTIYLASNCSSWCSGSTLELERNITFMSNFLCTFTTNITTTQTSWAWVHIFNYIY